ncbi:uncharacterized protein LOC123536153 [Mercenaria mercenaria]|uniref:uncharacterized protein LOC123536153 n=1 Tax=Mercenaria mercenaria TaxID=6596 RepID=UPI00234EFE37|nr:uncharacterized protein LOC123536153 [Mercenaria mercenaria]
MKNKIFIPILFIFSFSSSRFLSLAISDNTYSVLAKMFQAVMEDMQLQDDRIKALENNSATIRDDKIQKTTTDTPTKGNLSDNIHEYNTKNRERDTITQIQRNDIKDNIQQIKDYLIHMSKGLAVEKSMRAENTNTIGSLVDQNKESLNKLHQTIDHHGNAVENSFRDLETDLKAYGNKINSHTDQVIRNFTKEYKEELDKTEREHKEGIKNIADVIENIQKDVEQLKQIMVNTLNSNLAFGKSATASSTYYGKGATAATDGVKSGNWGDGSCTHTVSEMNPWWQVDLQRPYLINRVVITNRADCCGERLHSLVISVSKEQGSTEEICGHFEGPSTNGATETIQCYNTVFGRYLKIQMSANSVGILTLCEVEIFAT